MMIKDSLIWWKKLSIDTQYSYFNDYCNRYTRDFSSITEEEIYEIWLDNNKTITLPIDSIKNILNSLDKFQNNLTISEIQIIISETKNLLIDCLPHVDSTSK